MGTESANKQLSKPAEKKRNLGTSTKESQRLAGHFSEGMKLHHVFGIVIAGN
jgi:hypothetical protein